MPVNRAGTTQRAIIVAAGKGYRLLPHTADFPKCMLEIGGRTLLDWQLEALKAVDITDVVLVRGYRGEAIRRSSIRFVDNADYERNNVLASLFCAEDALVGGSVISYSDILYTAQVLRKLLSSKGDITVVVDVAWRSRYEGREGHPVAEAELVTVDKGQLVDAGKGIPVEEAHGEFIGLMKLTKKGADIFRGVYHRARVQYGSTQRPFHRAVTFQQAYLTDLFQELISCGIPIGFVEIDGGWMEIDVPRDLAVARTTWKQDMGA
jgi:choline kinase